MNWTPSDPFVKQKTVATAWLEAAARLQNVRLGLGAAREALNSRAGDFVDAANAEREAWGLLCEARTREMGREPAA